MKIIISNISYLYDSLNNPIIDTNELESEEFRGVSKEEILAALRRDCSMGSTCVPLPEPLSLCGLNTEKAGEKYSAWFWFKTSNPKIFNNLSSKLKNFANEKEVWMSLRQDGIGYIVPKRQGIVSPIYTLARCGNNDNDARAIYIGTAGAMPRDFTRESFEGGILELGIKAEIFLNAIYGSRNNLDLDLFIAS